MKLQQRSKVTKSQSLSSKFGAPLRKWFGWFVLFLGLAVARLRLAVFVSF